MTERCDACGMYWGDPHNCYPPEQVHKMHSSFLRNCATCRFQVERHIPERLIDVA